MNKGLEALKLIYESQDKDLFAIIEKELKALEIIKTKRVDVELWRFTSNRDYYNKLVCEDRQLTEEEHDLLKEVLK